MLSMLMHLLKVKTQGKSSVLYRDIFTSSYTFALRSHNKECMVIRECKQNKHMARHKYTQISLREIQGGWNGRQATHCTPPPPRSAPVHIVPDRIFCTQRAVGLLSLVDKGATRSIISKFDIIIVILFTARAMWYCPVVSCPDAPQQEARVIWTRLPGRAQRQVTRCGYATTTLTKWEFDEIGS